MILYRTNWRGLIFFSWMILFFMVSGAEAYTEKPVENGATVSGKVNITGTVPSAKLFHLDSYAHPDFCGQLSNGKGFRELHEFVTDESGGFQEVVVAIEEIEAGKPFDFDQTDVLSKLCEFLPFLVVVRDNHVLSVKNVDPVPHITQGYEMEGSRDPVIFNLPLMEHDIQTSVIEHSGDRRIFWMQCGIHPYMQTWGYSIRNPYYQITGSDGSFRIEDVPAGEYKIIAWHPLMKIVEKQITVTQGGAVNVNLRFDGDELRHLKGPSEYEGRSISSGEKKE